jgi:hypothetical protein
MSGGDLIRGKISGGGEKVIDALSEKADCCLVSKKCLLYTFYNIPLSSFLSE